MLGYSIYQSTELMIAAKYTLGATNVFSEILLTPTVYAGQILCNGVLDIKFCSYVVLV